MHCAVFTFQDRARISSFGQLSELRQGQEGSVGQTFRDKQLHTSDYCWTTARSCAVKAGQLAKGCRSSWRASLDSHLSNHCCEVSHALRHRIVVKQQAIGVVVDLLQQASDRHSRVSGAFVTVWRHTHLCDVSGCTVTKNKGCGDQIGEEKARVPPLLEFYHCRMLQESHSAPLQT